MRQEKWLKAKPGFWKPVKKGKEDASNIRVKW
jgi:hypothetical protein